MTKQKNANKKAGPDIDLAIVGGAGHVGLPLALSFVDKGLTVLIQDINKEVLEIIAEGRMPWIDQGCDVLLASGLASGRLHLASDPQAIDGAGKVIVTVGTPVDEFLNPDHKAFRSCIDGIALYLQNSNLMILRSTVFPGTTDWLYGYLQEQGMDLPVAYCPERVVQGLALEELRSVPQIISGTTSQAVEEAAGLFTMLAPSVVYTMPKEAEFAKLFANAYRYIQFATANQFYMIATSAGLDYHNIHKAITQDYPRASDLPRAGFAAGPCLFKDTMQLAAFANNQFSLGHNAMLINEGLVLFLIEQVQNQYNLGELTVGLLGMAFKADIDDTRASLSYKLKNMLTVRARKVLTTDPYVKDDPGLINLDQVIAQSDLLFLCVPHSQYKDLIVGETPVIDVWGFLADHETD
ncbi:MAG: nucleotide sugar dehydrogenase [Kiritimatiellia bacterium]|jgi:UDP-N-acetyl-D-mannosaminuronic acid dehydrogenase|nr:nucleotide sugar dehydrogenase [Kiritimatiellia bacterium]|tara:strand:+ start:1716 stop:2942 length:1227 start_codon:yes stop_codon:yes gene_type:complete